MEEVLDRTEHLQGLVGGAKEGKLEFELQEWEYKTVGTLSVGRPKVAKTLVEILGGWEKDVFRVEKSGQGQLEVVLDIGEVIKFGLRTLEMETSWEASTSRGVSAGSTVSRKKGVEVIFLGTIPVLLL